MNDKNYIHDAQFLEPERSYSDIEHRFPQDPDEYTRTNRFNNRFRDLKIRDIITGGDIRDIISNGRAVPSSQDTCSFVEDYDGIAFYVVVGDSVEGHGAGLVTLWAYVWDEDTAWVEGWTHNQINQIQKMEPNHLDVLK